MMRLAAMRSRLRTRTREVSTRKQVGDTASMVNEVERPLLEEDARKEL